MYYRLKKTKWQLRRSPCIGRGDLHGLKLIPVCDVTEEYLVKNKFQ